MAPIARKLATWTYMICYLIHWRITYGDTETPAGDTKPYQVHLSFGQTTKDIVVMAATHVNCSSSVFYGDDYYSVETQVSGKTVFFGEAELNPRGLHYLHRFVIKDLKPGKRYFYRVGCNVTVSDTKAFQVPENGTNWSPNFLVYGDLGLETRSIPALLKEVHSGNYTAVLHLGDFAYDLETDGGEKGDKFMDMIEPIASELPYLTTPGNHEVAKDTFVQYRYRFSTPTTTWPIPLDHMWYSMNIGPVHLISYSTEVFNMTDKQYIALQRDWLTRDLTAANRNRETVPWIVAMGHQPFYCSSAGGRDCTKQNSVVRANLESIFFQFGVDLVVNGQERAYERLWPTNKGTVHAENYTDPTAPVTIISGLAGSKEGEEPMESEPGEWTAFHTVNDSLNSYGILSIKNKTHLYWEQKSAVDDSILDSFWIDQAAHGKFVTVSPEEEKEVETNPPPTVEIAEEGGDSFSKKAKKVVQKVKAIIQSNKPIAIGVASAISVLVLIGIMCVVVRCRRRKSTRRWERLDYDKSFYSDVKTAEDDFSGEETEFQVDGNGALSTSKLLSKTTI